MGREEKSNTRKFSLKIRVGRGGRNSVGSNFFFFFMPKSHLTREGIIVCYIRYSWEDDDADQGEYLDNLTSLTLSLNVSRILKLDMLGIMCYIMEVKHGDYLAKTAVKHNCVCFLLCSRERCNNFFHVNCLSHFWSRTSYNYNCHLWSSYFFSDLISSAI